MEPNSSVIIMVFWIDWFQKSPWKVKSHLPVQSYIQVKMIVLPNIQNVYITRMCFQKTACVQKIKLHWSFFKWPKYLGLPMVCLLWNENQQFAHKWKISKLLAEMFILLNIYFTELYSTSGATWWPNVALPKYTKLDPYSSANKWLSTCVKPSQIIWVISVTF